MPTNHLRDTQHALFILHPSSFRLPLPAFRFLRSAFFILHPSSFILLLSAFILLLSSCTPPTPIPLSTESSLFVFRFSPPALLEYNADLSLAREIPVNLPCPLTAAHAAPTGLYLALEMECVNGPSVQIVDTRTGKTTTPFPDVDSHFLAWDFSGHLYLRVDALGNMRLMRVTPDGNAEQFPLSASTYDMNFSPDGLTIAYSFTRGLGLGSDVWAATATGSRTWQLRADRDSIITFARWSPDGQCIAFIAMPDTSTPFPLGELWVMDADGGHARPLAQADAGRGYAAAWSPDSTRIAFVGRDNPDDPRADSSAGALVSNIYLVEMGTGSRPALSEGEVSRVTHFEGAWVESPVWSADGHFLAFPVVSSVDDTMSVWIADLASGQVRQIENDSPLGFPAWIRK